MKRMFKSLASFLSTLANTVVANSSGLPAEAEVLFSIWTDGNVNVIGKGANPSHGKVRKKAIEL